MGNCESSTDIFFCTGICTMNAESDYEIASTALNSSWIQKLIELRENENSNTNAIDNRNAYKV